MKQIYSSCMLVLLTALHAAAQINYTANDAAHVMPYTGNFLFGSNMGYYPPWTNQTIADIAAGNASKNVKGAGVKTLHLPLPENFLDTWGYDVSVNDFIHYNDLGVKDNTVFLEFPTTAHTDNTIYPGCTDHSLIWSNLYTPIWDGGANGTPVNDNNYLALYIYNTVTRYKQWVKFWELVNEPDFDGGTIGWRSPGDPAGNWWDRNPMPCELYNVKAPIFNYIRMMRIAYEVIKTVDPNAYVAMGGVGYPSFLDAVCRNTDNPTDGSVNASYPVKGGAYFDCMSFHYYPMYDLRYYDAGVLKYDRHSDAAIDAYLGRKNTLDSVLATRGYNGTTYPRKVFINTENNIPRKPFGNYVGGDEVQRNYDMKALIESQLNAIQQFYIFSIGDSKDYASATDPFDVVGLYQPLTGIGPTTSDPAYRQQYNNSGIAYKTFSDALSGFSPDLARTTQLNLPAGVRGGAFKNAIGDYIYALWATTTIDNSEVANAVYSFPPAITMPVQVNALSWDYAQTNTSSSISPQNIALTGSPLLILTPLVITALKPDTGRTAPEAYFSFSIYPNPAKENLTLKVHLKKRGTVSVKITDGAGQLLMQVADNTVYNAGDNSIHLTLPSRLAGGIYYCRLVAGGNDQTIKFIVVK